MDKLETLLKERYGSVVFPFSDRKTFCVNNSIWIYFNIRSDEAIVEYKSVNIYCDEELVFYCGHKSVLNNDFLIDTILKVVDELISKN